MLMAKTGIAGKLLRRKRNRLILMVLGAKGIAIIVAVLLAIIMTIGIVGDRKEEGSGTGFPGGTAVTAGGSLWDAGNIISDEVFYNAAALPDEAAIQAAIDRIAPGCLAASCLGRDTYPLGDLSGEWCSPVSGGGDVSYAKMLRILAEACSINPQVAIVIVQKESQGFTRPSPPAALTGFGCPDTGPGGSANCRSGDAGVWPQTAGMFNSLARMRKAPERVNYLEGQTHDILWNVVETGCGASPVFVQNRATASLYTYTPYQPNEASLAAYPGEGDQCSAYGNRNFFRMFQQYFGPTGGGKPAPGEAPAAGAGAPGSVQGVAVTIPASAPSMNGKPSIAAGAAGFTIQAPNEGVAKGLAAGMQYLGYPYVWGGGYDGSGPNDGCNRGGGDLNSCQGLTGFDCSGFTAYVAVSGGFSSPGGNSSAQRASRSVPFDQGLPGDIIGFPGHVAVYIGMINGQRWIMEASDVGTPIHIVPLTRGGYDQRMYRYW